MNVSSINQYSRIQHDSNVNNINREQESVTVEYSSVDSYYEHLMLFAMKQASIFAAIQLIYEAGNLNEGKGLPENYMRKVKMHFIKKDRQQNEKHFENKGMIEGESQSDERRTAKTRNENVEKEIVNIDFRGYKSNFLQNHFAGIEFHNNQRQSRKTVHSKNLQKEMLKGYINLLTENINKV